MSRREQRRKEGEGRVSLMLRGLFALRSINRSRLVAPQLLRIYLRRPHALSSLHSAMPPKAAAAKRGKRKVESTSPEPKEEAQEPATEAAEEVENDEDDKPKKAKRAKKVKEPVKPLDPSVPTNLAVPDDLAPFPRPAEGSLRISAWNVAGLRASEKKGFSRYVEAEDADILVYRYWGDHSKKGHAGTAIFSKIKPLNVTRGFQASDEVSAADSEGRMVTLEFENSYLIGTYVPNAGAGLKTLPEKEKWNRAFETYLRDLDAKKPVIWCGDMNVVATPLDIRNWKTNYNKSAGCTDSEIDAFKAQLNPEEGSGHQRLVDVWRERNGDKEGHYTYYSYKFKCREKGIGWRIDYHVVSERLVPKVKDCEIRAGIWGASDHVPLVLDIEGPL
ncbi:putative DNA-(apurinic or apyrimidinic site) lyase [Rhodotorula taiwanensis]|uniref:DNA-(apurinic or apyrimidinic site) endonuclease n=1 Tax=Rhodotorula taiwanensis TaxID=741276 RepID=A0A2S5B1E4_9BASI|nr:putative DNA-(apurinic or apyrimidinic site) lyase [Rhodotorula taiwanensis]